MTPGPILACLLATLPLVAPSRSAAAAGVDSTAVRMWRDVMSTPWGLELEEWKRRRPSSQCEPDLPWLLNCPYGCGYAECDGAFRFFLVGLDAPMPRLLYAEARERVPDSTAAARLYQALLRVGRSRSGPPVEEPISLFHTPGLPGASVYWPAASDSLVAWAAHSPFEVVLAGCRQPLAHALEIARPDMVDPLARTPLQRRIDHALVAELRGGHAWLPATLETPQNGPALRRALESLLATAETAPSSERDVLRLAADRVATRGAWSLPDSVWDASGEPYRFVRGGDTLTFEYSPLGDVGVYGHDLIRGLRTQAGSAEVRNRAFLLLLEMGFEAGCCSHGEDLFRDVIREGESFLADRKDHRDAHVVHYFVGAAYETWWSLSLTAANDEYIDSSRYASGAGEARGRAIAHYRETVRLAPRNSPEAMEAAWRLPALVLGHDTRQRRYWSFYD